MHVEAFVAMSRSDSSSSSSESSRSSDNGGPSSSYDSSYSRLIPGGQVVIDWSANYQSKLGN